MNLSKTSTWWVLLGAFFLLGMLIYGRSIGYEFVRWDDGLLIYENPAIRGLTLENLKTIFTTYDPELYIPLTLLSYQLDYLIGGINPSIYHFQNLVLHVFNALSVTLFFYLLSRKSWVSVVGGLLFLSHPLHTETVVWASARKDLLSTLLLLLSLNTYLLFKGSGDKRIYLSSVFCFALALMAKVTVIGLPLIIILLAWFKRLPLKRALTEATPYTALSMVFGIIALNGKTAVLESATIMETVLMAGKSTVFYLSKLFVPVHLSVVYPFNEQITVGSPVFFVPLLLVIAIVVATIISLRTTRFITWCLGLFALTLAPSLLNFAKAGTYYFASDRYAYIPSIGIIFLVASLLSTHKYKTQISALLIVVLSVATGMQARVWATTQTLFEHATKHYPESHVAHNNIGNEYRRVGNIDSAIASYGTALKIEPYAGRNSAIGSRTKAQVLSNLGSAKRANGELDAALTMLLQARELDPLNPQAALALGITYQQLGQYEQSEVSFMKAIELQPTLSVAHLNLGALYMAINRVDDAIIQYEQTITLNPHFPQAHYNLGIALRKLERNREARDAFEMAIELEPSFVAARINLGIIYAERRELEAAREQFNEALRYDPQNTRALSALQQLNGL